MGVPDRIVAALERVRGNHATPEDIDDSPDSAPGKRTAGAISTYEKSVHGPPVATEIGLIAIHEQYPRFHEWMRRLKAQGKRG